ncbi:DUF6896 domain-containing protein [Halarcobacter sp.]|uniref:DUF6896 domain-containing protein n=1 Tax=Halarcobacter sp. TaxID=2321133 RepID=UPI002AAB3655|nr:hypothetical protein [Halarcobacter sp.]
MNKLNSILKDYFDDIKRCKSLFKEKFGQEFPLTLWRKKAIPKESIIKEGINYSFHGVGCYIQFENYGIDFDENFDPVFDYYKLKDYIEEKNNYLDNNYYDLKDYNIQLNEGLENGLIEKVSGALYKITY